jgi:hypothetical protein
MVFLRTTSLFEKRHFVCCHNFTQEEAFSRGLAGMELVSTAQGVDDFDLLDPDLANFLAGSDLLPSYFVHGRGLIVFHSIFAVSGRL